MYLAVKLLLSNLKGVVVVVNRLATAGLTTPRSQVRFPSAAICPWGHLTSHKRVERAVGGTGEISPIHRDTLNYKSDF